MYIEPNTVIKIYKGIPLDNTYEHTLYFDSVTAQNNYFHGTANSKIIQTFLRNTYQRVNKGRMRLQATADSLYSANYMAFQNTAYGNKWFYAFVNSVEYVNDVTTEIEFELDVMQTYAFNYTIGTVFVEREHSVLDSYDDWLIPEALETGDYICDSEAFLSFGTPDLTIYTDYDFGAGEPSVGLNYRQGGAIGGNTRSFSMNPDTIATESERLRQTVDAINNAGYTVEYAQITCPAMSSLHYDDYSITISKPLFLDGYQPKNKKMLTSPYTYLLCDTSMGNSGMLQFEYFGVNNSGSYETTCTISAVGTLLPAPSVWSIPKNYKGVQYNYNEAFSSNGFPIGAILNDTYKEYLARHQNTLYNKAITDVVTFGVGAIATASGAGALVGTGMMAGSIKDVANTYTQLKDRQIGSKQSMGRNTGEGMLVYTGLCGLKLYTMSITRTSAKSIDDYFTKYGYATRRLKIPNRNSRPHWNYVKTIGMELNNNECPTDDARKICAIYDKGITFWKNASEVGDYSLDNSPQ